MTMMKMIIVKKLVVVITKGAIVAKPKKKEKKLILEGEINPLDFPRGHRPRMGIRWHKDKRKKSRKQEREDLDGRGTSE